MSDKKIISGLFPDEFKSDIIESGYKAFRAKQVFEWIYRKGILSFSGMKNVPLEMKLFLEKSYCITNLTCEKVSESADKTKKYLFKTSDDEYIESVLIPQAKRMTVCLSTQAGCAFGCAFCASGKNGLKRNLTVSEIVSQVLLIKKDNEDKPITNVVFMGMGEPLANYDNVLKAVRIINNPECIHIAARKITLSTCGLPEEILRLAQEGIQVELSISLHAANDKLRGRLVPVNKKFGLKKLISTAIEYTNITNRIITFEYILIGKINDNKEDAFELADLLDGLKCKVNLIPYNSVEGSDFIAPERLFVSNFAEVLEDNNTNVTIRRSRGMDIKGACGQLVLQKKAQE